MKSDDSCDSSCEDSTFSSKPKRYRRDWFFVIPFVLFIGLVVAVTIGAVHRCDDPVRYYNGMDSWGYVCHSNLGPPGPENTSVRLHDKRMLDRPYLWRVGNEILIDRNVTACAGELMTSSVQLCVENCPESLTTVASCHVLLNLNGEKERSHRYNTTIAQCTRLEELMIKCDFNRSSFGSGTDVYSRCLPKNAVNDVYDSMENFLTFWLYFLNDFRLNLRVLVVTVFMLGVLTLASCLIITALPEGAFIYCNILSVILLLVSSGWHAMAYFQSDDDFSVYVYQYDLMTAIRVALIAVPLLISVNIIIHFINDFHFIPGARCILKETSSCLNAMYKIFGLGYLDILSYIAIIFVLLQAFRYAFTCYNYSTTTTKKSEEIDPIFPYDWVLLPVLGVWLFTVVKILVGTIVAHSVALWYFSEKKLLRKGWMGCKAMIAQTGAVIGCSSNGCAIHAIATGLLIFGGHHTPIKVGSETKTKFTRSERVFAYLSPYSPASIGVYGHVRPTIISYHGRDWIFPVVGRLRKLKPKNRYQRLIEKRGAGWVIQKSHAIVRWYLWWLQVSLTFIAVLIYSVLLEVFNIKLHLLEIDLLVAFVASFCVTGSLFNVLYVSIDATVLCFTKDLSQNPGSKKPFYSSNAMIFGLTNSRVSSDETYWEIERKEQMEKETQLLKEKIKRRMSTAREVREGDREFSFDNSDDKNEMAHDQLHHYFKAKHRLSRKLGNPNDLMKPKKKRQSTSKVTPENPVAVAEPAAMAGNSKAVVVAQPKPATMTGKSKAVVVAQPKPTAMAGKPKPVVVSKPADKQAKPVAQPSRPRPRRNDNNLPPDPTGAGKVPTLMLDNKSRSTEYAEIEKELEELRQFKSYMQSSPLPRRGARMSQDSLPISTASSGRRTHTVRKYQANKSTDNSWIETAEVVTTMIPADNSMMMMMHHRAAVVGKKEVRKEKKPSSSIDPAAAAAERKPFK